MMMYQTPYAQYGQASSAAGMYAIDPAHHPGAYYAAMTYGAPVSGVPHQMHIGAPASGANGAPLELEPAITRG